MQDGSTMMLAITGGYVAFWLTAVVIMVVSGWALYAKAGQPGWAALVPIYNVYVLTQIVGRPGWWTLLTFVPGVNTVVAVVLTYDLAKAFGFGVGMTVGLTVAPVLFCPMLAFGPATYGPASPPSLTMYDSQVPSALASPIG